MAAYLDPGNPRAAQQLALELLPRCLSAALALVRLAVGWRVIRWRTDRHLTAAGKELTYHAGCLVLARFAARCFDASPMGRDRLRKPNAFTQPFGAVEPTLSLLRQ